MLVLLPVSLVMLREVTAVALDLHLVSELGS